MLNSLKEIFGTETHDLRFFEFTVVVCDHCSNEVHALPAPMAYVLLWNFNRHAVTIGEPLRYFCPAVTLTALESVISGPCLSLQRLCNVVNNL